MTMLNGYKTYIVAGVTILYTAIQLWTGAIDGNTALFAILAALGLGGLRHGTGTKA
jgi:hypothetical protein